VRTQALHGAALAGAHPSSVQRHQRAELLRHLAECRVPALSSAVRTHAPVVLSRKTLSSSAALTTTMT
jgi:hypothetical protein